MSKAPGMNSENKKSDNSNCLKSRFYEKFAEALTETPEFRRMVKALAPQAVKVWAGKSRLKKVLSAPVVKSIEKGFTVAEDETSPIADLMIDEEFLLAASKEVPVIFNSVMNAFDSAVAGLNSQPEDYKARILKDAACCIDFKNPGRIVTGIAALINSLHESNPEFFNEALRPGIADFIESTDFGELKEAMAGSGEDFSALIKTLNEELWRYPAKVVLLLSFVPMILNMLLVAVRESLSPMNRLAPDLLSDVVQSLIKDVDTETVGNVINELSELVRKIHTGSALLGEPGKPALPSLISGLSRDTLDSVDVELFFKSGNLLSDMKEMMYPHFISLLEDNPGLAREFLRSQGRSLLSLISRWNQKTEAFEIIFTDEELAEEMKNFAAQIDPQEAGAAISRIAGILNRINENSPGIMKDTISGIINSIDSYEAGEFMRRVSSDMAEAAKPLASEIAPPLIRGIADLIKNDESGEIRDAVNYLRNALDGKGENR